MFLIQTRFWWRVLASGVAVALVAFGIAAMDGGGWGPCGPSDVWSFYAALTGLLSAAMAIASVPGLMLSMLLRVLLRRAKPTQRCR